MVDMLWPLVIPSAFLARPRPPRLRWTAPATFFSPPGRRSLRSPV